jgi:MFS family permease
MDVRLSAGQTAIAAVTVAGPPKRQTPLRAAAAQKPPSPSGQTSEQLQQPSSQAFEQLSVQQPSDEPAAAAAVTTTPTTAMTVSRAKGVTVIVTLAGITFLNTMGSGILIAALPRIADDVGLDRSLMLWPAAVYALAAGCLLLIFGAVADVVGPKRMWVTGSFLFLAFTLAIGLARTGPQIIAFRTLLGASISMCLPTAVSLITNTFPRGPWRNVAFSMNGVGSPLGFATGLVLGGVFTDTIGWRWAYYMMAMLNACLSLASLWSLPSVNVASERKWADRLMHDIDWMGALIMSAALGILLYVLAMTSSSYKKLSDPTNIALLVISVVMLAVFPFWMHYQVKRGKPALIPNKLWRNVSFTSVCLACFLAWASLNGIEYFTTLYFQEVQGLTALQSSIRFLPHVVMGIGANILTGLLIAKVSVRTLTVGSGLVTMVAAPLMATVPVGQSYWFSPFWALFLSPMNPDVLFTVSNLIISNAYPPELQSLAGGVFNEVSQFGNSVGLAITAAIAASVSEHSSHEDHAAALMKGYRAAFWTIFAGCVGVTVVCWFGMRRTGIVGKKDD